MEKIKSFIYLDNEKTLSMASQVFEGLVQHYIESNKNITTEEETQKGGIGSGNTLADVITKETNKSENKFLHNFLYNKFEKELSSNKLVTEINNYNVDDISKLKNNSFVKLKGNIIFNDSNTILKIVKEFNNLGYAIAYLQLNNLSNNNSLSNKVIDDFQKKYNLKVDKKFLEQIEYILKYGFEDTFEVQLTLGDYTFTTYLDTKYLKENEKIIIKKYSRNPKAEFTVFGVITQDLNNTINKAITENNDTVNNDTVNNSMNFKEIYRNLISSFIQMEKVFNENSKNEIIIDPIAIYTEL